MHSSSVRTSKSQLGAEQPLIGGGWSPPKKAYPTSKDKGETAGKAPETLGCHKQNLVCNQDPGERSSVPHKD